MRKSRYERQDPEPEPATPEHAQRDEKAAQQREIDAYRAKVEADLKKQGEALSAGRKQVRDVLARLQRELEIAVTHLT